MCVCVCVFEFNYMTFGASLVSQMVKNLPAMQEAWIWSLGWEDPMEKEMVTFSSILTWRIPWTGEPGRLQSTGLQRVRHDWATSLSLSNRFSRQWPESLSVFSCFFRLTRTFHIFLPSWIQWIFMGWVLHGRLCARTWSHWLVPGQGTRSHN